MSNHPKNYIKQIHSGQKHFSSRLVNSKEDGLFLKIGKIVRVDYEQMRVDIVLMDSIGSYPKVAVSAGYAGYRSFLGAMPHTNDWVILAFAKTGDFREPFIVQFLPRGYIQGIKHDIINVPQSLKNLGIHKPLRFKMQKLYEGEIYGSSTYGSEILLDKNVSISNSKLNEIFIKAADQSISFNAVNLFQSSSGVRTQSGLIYRNELIDKPDFKSFNGSKFPIYYNEEGTPNYNPVYKAPITFDSPYGKYTIDDGGKPFIEYRTEVLELAEPIMNVTPFNSGSDVDSFYKRKVDGKSEQPLVIQVLGTLVGNDPNGEIGQSRYGTILRPTLFSSPTSVRGMLDEVPCVLANGKDEVTTLAAAYTLKFPNSGTAFYVDKQGKYFANIGASTAIDPVGAGESAEINMAGQARVFLGKNALHQRSLSMFTEGGVYTNWGFEKDKSRSWDAVFGKGVSWDILGSDIEGNSFKLECEGDVKKLIKGSRFTEIQGNDIRLVHGVIEDRIFGRKIDHFVNDKASTYGGNFGETTIGHHSKTIAQGQSTTIYGPELSIMSVISPTARSNTILLGDDNLKMVLGRKSDTILAGSYTSTIGGPRTVNTATMYSANAGISSSIKAGVSVSTLAGATTSITSGASTTIYSPTTSVRSGFVNIGAAAKPGVITEMMRCYITGAPHWGSKTVRCNPF